MRCFAYLLAILACLCVSCTTEKTTSEVAGRFHNVIVLIPDGCGVGHMTVARWYKGATLAQDSMDVSLVRTHSASSMITGSALAATALATGYETWGRRGGPRCVSMLPESVLIPVPRELPRSDQWRPVATVLEGAGIAGKATGLVSTARITDATPAAYAGHWHSRYYESILAKQIVYQDIDVVLGGGGGLFVDPAGAVPGSRWKGRRKDGVNLFNVLASRGYETVTTREGLNNLGSGAGKVWGVFAGDVMAYDLDRSRFVPDEPTLAEMTGKALEILSKDPDGFFLMVEGGLVDWASHNNDPVGAATEYLAFDRAVEAAIDFAQANPQSPTLVLVVPDHDNGGMSLGRRDGRVDTFLPDDMTNVLSRASLTAAGVQRVLRADIDRHAPDRKTIRQVMAREYGINDLTEEELGTLAAEFADTLRRDGEGQLRTDPAGRPLVDTTRINLREIIGPILSRRAGIGWTSYDHTGADVPMFSRGLRQIPKTINNTAVAHLCAQAMGFSLADLNARLIVDAAELFGKAALTLDTSGVNWGGGHLFVKDGEKEATLPFFTDLMVINQDTLLLEGLILYSLKAHRVFVPGNAREVFAAYQSVPTGM